MENATTDVASGWTVFLQFDVNGANEQQVFLDAYRPVVEKFVSDWPGFLGATLYASTDGTRVINQTRWVDEAAYLNFVERSDPEPRMRAIEEAFASVAQMRGPDMSVVHTYRPITDVVPAVA